MKNSSKQGTALVIGHGLIGTYLKPRIEKELGLVVMQIAGETLPDIVFVAISTRDTGEAARDYILKYVQLGIPVVTCEKGSLAYHAEELMFYVASDMIGFDAACGGGSHILSKARKHVLFIREFRANAVLNSTLNFIGSRLEAGKTPDEACEEAKAIGIVEPGSKNFAEMIRGEIHDVLMKTCVFYNTVFLTAFSITPDMFDTAPLTSEGIDQLITLLRSGYRMVISFDDFPNKRQYFSEGTFKLTTADFHHIQGGFCDISNESTDFRSWFPQGIENGILVVEAGKVTLEVKGLGARPQPTTDAMIADARKLLGRSL